MFKAPHYISELLLRGSSLSRTLTSSFSMLQECLPDSWQILYGALQMSIILVIINIDSSVGRASTCSSLFWESLAPQPEYMKYNKMKHMVTSSLDIWQNMHTPSVFRCSSFKMCVYANIGIVCQSSTLFWLIAILFCFCLHFSYACTRSGHIFEIDYNRVSVVRIRRLLPTGKEVKEKESMQSGASADHKLLLFIQEEN